MCLHISTLAEVTSHGLSAVFRKIQNTTAIQQLEIINLENVLPYQHEGSDFFSYEFTLTREIMDVIQYHQYYVLHSASIPSYATYERVNNLHSILSLDDFRETTSGQM